MEIDNVITQDTLDLADEQPFDDSVVFGDIDDHGVQYAMSAETWEDSGEPHNIVVTVSVPRRQPLSNG